MTPKNRTLEGKNWTSGGEGSKIVENRRTSFMYVPLWALLCKMAYFFLLKTKINALDISNAFTKMKKEMLFVSALMWKRQTADMSLIKSTDSPDWINNWGFAVVSFFFCKKNKTEMPFSLIGCSINGEILEICNAAPVKKDKKVYTYTLCGWIFSFLLCY